MEKEKVIKKISSLLNEYYLFPEIAIEITSLLNENFKKGFYDEMNNSTDFANKITSDLQSINNDLHLKLKFDPDNEIGKLKLGLKNRIELSRKENFGFEEIKILKGNIGYLKLNKFENPIFSGDTLTAAMNFLGNTDAMIIDVSNNPGGNIPMGELMASYFFNDRIHLSSFDYREYDIVHHTYTAPYVSGKQFLDKDLYILISDKSASLAEAFSYELKHLERATIVGEQSAGAAHSGSHREVGDYKLYVPNGRPINPKTNSNWERIGVTPDIKVSKAESISATHLLALKKLYSNSNENAYENAYEKIIKTLKIDSEIEEKINKWLKTERTSTNNIKL